MTDSRKRPGPVPKGWAPGFSVRFKQADDDSLRGLAKARGKRLIDIVREAVDFYLKGQA